MDHNVDLLNYRSVAERLSDIALAELESWMLVDVHDSAVTEEQAIHPIDRIASFEQLANQDRPNIPSGPGYQNPFENHDQYRVLGTPDSPGVASENDISVLLLAGPLARYSGLIVWRDARRYNTSPKYRARSVFYDWRMNSGLAGPPAEAGSLRKKLQLISGGITYAEGVPACSPGLQCEASCPGFKSPASSTLKALLPTRFQSAITPLG